MVGGFKPHLQSVDPKRRDQTLPLPQNLVRREERKRGGDRTAQHKHQIWQQIRLKTLLTTMQIQAKWRVVPGAWRQQLLKGMDPLLDP